MKYFLVLLFCIFYTTAWAQKDSVNNAVTYEFYNQTDAKAYSLDFKKTLKSDSVLSKVYDSIQKIGYYTLAIDSINGHKVFYRKGKQYKTILVKNDHLFPNKKDWISTNNLDSLVNVLQKRNDSEGFSFSSIEIHPIDFEEGKLRVSLVNSKGSQRTISGVKVVGYEKLSKGYIKHVLKLKKNQIYSDLKLKEASEQISYNVFLKESRSPQTLFTKDSTIVYLYVDKVKSNYFDGILGFGNDENGDFKINGNVKLELNNAFNGLEKISLNWVATATQNSTLDFDVNIPYLFKSPIGSETGLSVLKQDSTFVNTSLNERLYYQISQRSNIGLNLGYESSNFVLDDYPEIAALYDDYNKTKIGGSYRYIQPINNLLLEAKTRFYLLAQSIKKKENNYLIDSTDFNESYRQYEIGLELFHIFNLSHQKHWLKTSVEAYTLTSESDATFSDNELYRIGGFGSIRGFNEKSIVASSYAVGSIEYRFMPNEGFYITAFSDFGWIENKLSNIHEQLLSFGSGLSFLTRLGIFNLTYAVGKYSETPFDFKNSKIHFGILSRF